MPFPVLATTPFAPASPLFNISNPALPATPDNNTTAVSQAPDSAEETGPQISYGALTPEADEAAYRHPRSHQINFANIPSPSILKASITYRAARKAMFEYFEATRDLTDDVLKGIVRDPGKTIATLYDDLYKDPAFPPKAAADEWMAVDTCTCLKRFVLRPGNRLSCITPEPAAFARDA